MTIIKFRAWDKETKTMIYPDKKENEKTADFTLNAWCNSENKRSIIMQFAGFALDDCELYAKDIIRFKYEDRIEETGFGYCTGVIEFENGCFVVKEIGFEHYDWNNEDQRPALLYDWLKDNDCEYVGNVFENPEL